MDVGNKSTSSKEAGSVSSKTVLDTNKAKQVWASLSTLETFDNRSMKAEEQACSPSCSWSPDTEEENKWPSLKTLQEFDYERPKPEIGSCCNWSNCNLL